MKKKKFNLQCFLLAAVLIATGCQKENESLNTAAKNSLKATTSISVRAHGTNGDEQLQLIVGGTTVTTWTLSTSYATYTASTSATGAVKVQFINDASGRDVQVDYAQYNGTTYQAEAQSINTGSWNSSSSSCGGVASEWLYCNGYIQFPDISGGSGGNSITVRARGTSGSEHINLKVGSTTITSWTLSTTMSSYNASTSLNSGEVYVQFDNDNGTSRDVQVDYIIVNGQTRQAEDQAYNTGVWQNSQCGGSYSEWLQCNGSIGFGDISGGSSSSSSSSSSSGGGGGGYTINANPNWNADARCFFNGPSGSFDEVSVKDPSIVYSGGRYHIFYTGRDASNWRMGYASATSIGGLASASHIYMSSLNGGSYFCAPEVFYFSAKGTWYLIYQSGLGATYSTNSDVGNPSGWAAGRQLFSASGVDFFCISDGSNVYCFWSPQDGSYTIKRRSTSVANFPGGWGSTSSVCSNTFEAPHVYKNLADGKYYMMVEDITRHFELWTATSLGGNFTQVSENWATASRLTYNADHWTDQVSHGEIFRAGTNEFLEVNDLNHCDILIQGVVNGNYPDYGSIPYDLGVIRNY